MHEKVAKLVIERATVICNLLARHLTRWPCRASERYNVLARTGPAVWKVCRASGPVLMLRAAHVPGSASRDFCPTHTGGTWTHAHVPGASRACCWMHSERGHACMLTYLVVLVGLAVALASLQLYLESLHADLEAIHWLDRSLGRRRVVKTHKACRERNDRTM